MATTVHDPEDSLRPVDLARLAGISTQQVRNYEHEGVLPPAPRTASGYRRYSSRHRDALLTYRALVAGHGPRTAQQVMRAVHARRRHEALALIDASHASQHDQRYALHATEEALRTLAQEPEAPRPTRHDMQIGEVATRVGVRPSALRVWEAAGLLSPDRNPETGYRRYRADDLRDARIIHLLRQSLYRFNDIRPILDDVRQAGGTTALSVALDRRRAELHRRAAAMLNGASLLHHYIQTHMPELDIDTERQRRHGGTSGSVDSIR
jgi:DNA-binding transcriptional MerR regulator